MDNTTTVCTCFSLSLKRHSNIKTSVRKNGKLGIFIWHLFFSATQSRPDFMTVVNFIVKRAQVVQELCHAPRHAGNLIMP